MTLHLELSNVLEARLVEAAQMRGMPPEAYAQELLEGSLLPQGSGRGFLSQEDFRAMLREMASGADTLPDLPDEAFTRASIYGDHP